MAAMSSAVSFRLNAEFDFVDWNSRAEAISNFAREEVVGSKFEDFLSLEIKDTVLQTLQQALVSDAPLTLAFPFFTKSGDQVDLDGRVAAKRDTKGNVLGVHFVSSQQADVKAETMRPVVTEALRFTLGMNLEIKEWPQKATQKLGFFSRELVGKVTFDTLLTQGHDSEVLKACAEAKAGRLVSAVSFPFYSKCGIKHDLVMHICPAFGPTGDVVGVCASEERFSWSSLALIATACSLPAMEGSQDHLGGILEEYDDEEDEEEEDEEEEEEEE